MREKKRAGFSLIEMLVVIVVISLLMGLVFKLFGPPKNMTAEARTTEKLEQTAFVLNEYFAEYGIYPPASGMRYMWENVRRTEEEYPESIPYYSSQSADPHQPPREHGLVAYLADCGVSRSGTEFHRVAGTAQWRQDSSRDENAKARWAPFAEGLFTRAGAVCGDGVTVPEICMNYDTIQDGWGRELIYSTQSPYETFELRSSGPDGNAYNDDDIIVDQVR